MQVGDIILPRVSDFPIVDRDGRPTLIEDEAVGQLARVLKVWRCFAKVTFVDTGRLSIYRLDEIELVYTSEEWKEQLAGLVR